MPQSVMTSSPVTLLLLLLVLSSVTMGSARPVELAGDFAKESESAALILNDRQLPRHMFTPKISAPHSGV
jgi:hypothetical protein